MQLTVENLSLKRGPHLLLEDISFTLSSGESLQLKGPNGIGKTTLLRALAGFAPKEAGLISLTAPPSNENQAPSDHLHYIGHKNGVRSNLTVYENLTFWLEFFETQSETETQTKIKHIAKTFSLTNLLHIPAGYLSQGQQRRLGLARLNLTKRSLWLLDEPTVSLDQKSASLIVKLAQNHLAEGGILITATHIPIDIPFTQTITLTRPKVTLTEDFI